MQFRLLGPFEASAGGRPLALGRRRERLLLAVLLLRPGRVVPVDRLIDLLWDEEPPANARRALHVHVARLRSALAPGAAAVRIETSGNGYLLQTDPESVDAHRFRRLVEQARRADAPAERSRVLREALALWRGPALADLADDHVRQQVCADLAEQRLTALEDRVAADLELGRHAELVAELTALTGQHPHRERLQGQLMLALYRVGRQVEALEVYARVRAALHGDFGVEPGEELRRLHVAMLRADPSVAAAAPPAAPAAQAVPAAPAEPPRQLPGGVAGFAGRKEHLKALDELLSERPAGAPTPVVITTIGGGAGVGKTALAVHWAHEVADRFPDGQLYVNLRGFAPNRPPMPPDQAIRGFLDALGVPADRASGELADLAALYRSRLADKRVLILLDNARDAEQVRPLLPGSPGCLVLVTSRNQLTSLVAVEGGRPVTLDVLTGAEARQLLANRLGAAAVDAEPEAAAELIARCAHLPLALAIVAARAATHGNRLGALAAELREFGGLDAFAGEDPAIDIRAVFSWSYAALAPAAARLFRLLGLHTGPDISAPAAASLAALPAARVRPLLAELVRACLVVEHAAGRYSFHDLLRAYAAEQARALDAEDGRRAAEHRMLDHYLRSAHAADRRLDPTRDRVELTAAGPGVAPEEPADIDAAIAWLTAERPVLLAATQFAADNGFDAHAWQIAWALGTFLERRGMWQDRLTLQRIAVAVTARQADQSTEGQGIQAMAERLLARSYISLGRYDDALTHLGRALELFTAAGDRAGQAYAHHNTAHVLFRRGEHRRALDHARQALELFRAAGHRRGEANALNVVGWLHAQLGEYREAIAHCEPALLLQQELGNVDGLAATWDSLGFAHRHLGDRDRAIECYERSLVLCREGGDRYEEANTLRHLAELHREAGHPGAARFALRQAVAVLDDLHHADAAQARAELDGLPKPP